MRFPETVFRKYDIRGIAGEEITEDFAYTLGLAFAQYVRPRNVERVAVGGDVRTHTPPLKEALIRGLMEGGLNVVDLGTVPTPVVYYSLFRGGVQASIQVTASHNPAPYNGFKMNLGPKSVFGEAIQTLRRIMEEGPQKAPNRGSRTLHDIVPLYVDDLTRRVEITRELHLVLDTGNGATGPVMTRLLARFPSVRVDGLYLDPDGNFPNHLPDPTVVKYMQDAITRVRETGADLAVGLDGDGDRIGAVTHEGRLLFGDQLLGIFARDVLSRHRGAPIIFDVKCSQGLVEAIERWGGRPLMWKTGHALLKAKLAETPEAPLAGEMSGHIFFRENFYGFDDALYATLRLLEILSRTGKSLKELAEEIPTYHATPEIRVGCPDEKKFAVVADLVGRVKREGYQVIDIDGARVQFDDGFVLVRASNTQPVLVVRAEARTPERLNELKELLRTWLSAYPEVDLSALEEA